MRWRCHRFGTVGPAGRQKRGRCRRGPKTRAIKKWVVSPIGLFHFYITHRYHAFVLRGSLASLALLIAAGSLHAAPGDLDPTFGSNGVVISSFGTNDIATATSMALQSDGRIVVGGFIRGDSSRESPAIARYTTNGVLDVSLGGKGWKSTRDWGGDLWSLARNTNAPYDATGVTLQADGKILFGAIGKGIYSDDLAIVRCHSNGTVDDSFGPEYWRLGYRLYGMEGFTAFGGIVVQPDGRIVFTKSTWHTTRDYSSSGVILNRLWSSGETDYAFGTNGSALILTNFWVGFLTGHLSHAYATVLQPDGRIIGGGFAYDGANSSAALARTLSDGSMDISFGGDGRQITPFQHFSKIAGLALQADGRIVAAGQVNNGIDYDMLLLRYNANGDLDTTFGSNGVVIAALGPLQDLSSGVAIQADGKIVVCGSFDNPTSRDSVLLRYNTNGAPDATFGSNGVVVTQFSPGNDYATALAIEPDGKIITAGYAVLSPSNHFALTRYDSGLGPSAEIDVRDSSNAPLTHTLGQLNVGSLLPGASNTVSLTIRNTGYTNLVGLAVAIDGTDAADFVATQPPVTDLPPGSNTTFTITFTAGDLGQRTAALHIVSNDLDENPFDVTLIGRGLIHIEAWRLANFGSPDDIGEGADTRDYEPDGAHNLLEFAVDSNPRQYGPIPATLANDGASLHFTCARNKNAIGELTFVVEWSDTLLPDDWHSDDVSESILSDDGLRQRVQATIPIGPGPARFVRLRVTRP